MRRNSSPESDEDENDSTISLGPETCEAVSISDLATARTARSPPADARGAIPSDAGFARASTTAAYPLAPACARSLVRGGNADDVTNDAHLGSHHAANAG